MNRKLLVIAMVPLLVGFAGALAFSTYDGTMTKTFQVTTGQVIVSESVYCISAHIQRSVQVYASFSGDAIGSWTFTGDDHGRVSQCAYIPECPTDPGCTVPSNAYLLAGPVMFIGPYAPPTSSITVTINHMLPGDYVEFLLVDTPGPGSLPAYLTASLTPSPGLSGETHLGGPALPYGSLGSFTPYFAPNANGWTYLSPYSASPSVLPTCAANIAGLGGTIDVGATTTTPVSTIGLEYCASGDFGPMAPAVSAGVVGFPAGPAPPGLEVGSNNACENLLIAFDGSADNTLQGVSGSVTESVDATP